MNNFNENIIINILTTEVNYIEKSCMYLLINNSI